MTKRLNEGKKPLKYLKTDDFIVDLSESIVNPKISVHTSPIEDRYI